MPLTLQEVLLDLPSPSKEQALRAMCAQMAARYSLPEDSFFAPALLQQSSAGVGNGVAIPYGLVEGLSESASVFARLQNKVDFGSMDQKKVDLVFLLFIPKEQEAELLQRLALVSRFLADPGNQQRLRIARDPLAVHSLFSLSESSQAA